MLHNWDVVRRGVMHALDRAKPHSDGVVPLARMDITIWFSPRTGEASNVEIKPTYKTDIQPNDLHPNIKS